MPDKAEAQDNVIRLLQHLTDGSLAALLVQAHHLYDAASSRGASKAVLNARLDQVREQLNENEN